MMDRYTARELTGERDVNRWNIVEVDADDPRRVRESGDVWMNNNGVGTWIIDAPGTPVFTT